MARKLLQKQLHAVEMRVRAILRNFGAKVGQTTSRGFEGRVRTVVEGQPTLQAVADALLAARTVLAGERAPSKEVSAFPAFCATPLTPYAARD